MQDVLHPREVHTLVAGEELNHANSPDIVFRVPPTVRGRALRLDQVLAVVEHERTRVEDEDLASDAGREDSPTRGNRRHSLSFSHVTPARSIPRPRLAVTLYPRYHLLPIGASPGFRSRAIRACRVELDQAMLAIEQYTRRLLKDFHPIIAANRPPVDLAPEQGDRERFVRGSGGLVTGLSGMATGGSTSCSPSRSSARRGAAGSDPSSCRTITISISFPGWCVASSPIPCSSISSTSPGRRPSTGRCCRTTCARRSWMACWRRTSSACRPRPTCAISC